MFSVLGWFGVARRGWVFEVLFGVWGCCFLVLGYFGLGGGANISDPIIRDISSVEFLVADF